MIAEIEMVVQGKKILITGEHAVELSQSRTFTNWLLTFDPSLKVLWLSEEWSYWRRKTGELVFAIFHVAYIDDVGKEKISLFFFRSDSAASLLVLEDIKSRKKFIVFIEQIRGPVGGKILEIPAGTLEEGESPAATMAREIKEETNLEVRPDELEFLGTYYFSPGACTEQITLYYCEKECVGLEIKELQNRLAGLREHGENTKVKIYSFDDFEKLKIRDAKTQLAYELYAKRYSR